jgi:hypothetical protein
MLQSANPILGTVLRTRVASEAEFDALHSAEISLALEDIERTHTTIAMCIVKGFSYVPSRIDGLALLNASINTLVSSLFLARQRAYVDAFALLRISVESACVAVHIVTNNRAYLQFKQSPKLYKSTTAISAVGHLIPKLREFYGVLSKSAVHVTAAARGTRIDNDGCAVVEIGQQPTSTEQDRIALSAISLAGVMVLAAVERTLFEEEPGQPSLIRLPGTDWLLLKLADSLIRDRAFLQN